MRKKGERRQRWTKGQEKVETRKWQQQRRRAAAGEAKPSGGSALRNQMTAKRLVDRPAATEFEPPPATLLLLLLYRICPASPRVQECAETTQRELMSRFFHTHCLFSDSNVRLFIYPKRSVNH